MVTSTSLCLTPQASGLPYPILGRSCLGGSNEGSHLLLSLGFVSPIPMLHLRASLWSTEVRLKVNRRKGFLVNQGSVSGYDAEEKEEEKMTRSRQRVVERESSPLLRRSQSLC